jgi:hypothetical protein
MKLSGLEQELEKRGRELMRILLQEHLDKLSHSLCEQPVCGSDGINRPNVRSHDRKIETVFGTVSTTRAEYGNEGVTSLHPLEAQLNLPPERYSLELRCRVAENTAKSSFDETLEAIEKTTGAYIPKRQLEEPTQRAVQKQCSACVPWEAVTILMNTGIFMKLVNTNGIIKFFIKLVKFRPQSFHNLRPDEIILE